ncbi:MAG: recombination factor protein RarA [Francisellaceae bacterium]|nr:recombination factor protein RarA [Francisellaceae bacterium]
MIDLPLAARLRPQTLDEFVGQEHLLGKDKPLYQSLRNARVQSMLFWGPPGTGKTTLAYLVAKFTSAHFVSLSAVKSGIKDIKAVLETAESLKKQKEQSTILFIDEIHRFNKIQQDALLPGVEEGVVTLIGATTENPSFEINNALLSRVRIYVLKPLEEKDILTIINRALRDQDRGFGKESIAFPVHLQKQLALVADGDARYALNLLNELVESAKHKNQAFIDEKIFETILKEGVRRFDKKGEYFYDLISALHKSIRGSSPDAALYWLARLLDGGMDPLYIARRLLRVASEDIGNADPKALQITTNAWDAYLRLGSPEGELALAQAVVYLSITAKSNAVYTAFQQAQKDAKAFGTQEVPLHLRNAPTKLMKALEYGKEYRYDHDEANAFSKGQTYFPDKMGEKKYYHPVPRGLEIQIKEKLENLKNHSE